MVNARSTISRVIDLVGLALTHAAARARYPSLCIMQSFFPTASSRRRATKTAVCRDFSLSRWKSLCMCRKHLVPAALEFLATNKFGRLCERYHGTGLRPHSALNLRESPFYSVNSNTIYARSRFKWSEFSNADYFAGIFWSFLGTPWLFSSLATWINTYFSLAARIHRANYSKWREL